jgi:hypothetical protein
MTQYRQTSKSAEVVENNSKCLWKITHKTTGVGVVEITSKCMWVVNRIIFINP